PLPGSALISSFVGERGATTGAAASRAVIASIASDMWISLLHHGRGGVVMDEPAALSPIFVARLERGREQVGRWSDTLERTLQELAASGRAAWPGIALDSETFRAHLGDRLRKCP